MGPMCKGENSHCKHVYRIAQFKCTEQYVFGILVVCRLYCIYCIGSVYIVFTALVVCIYCIVFIELVVCV
jgi:hypothetical protein